MTERVLILGAGSDIAAAVARCYAAEGAALCLVAREKAQLERMAADLAARGAGSVVVFGADLGEVDEQHLDQWIAALGGLDILLLAYGMMPDQELLMGSISRHNQVLNTNFVSAAGWLQLSAQNMATAGGGKIAVVTSVAGDRARKPNYIYGASKSALGFFAEGLGLVMADKGVHVCVVKPGQTRTRMTQHLDTQGPLWADAAVVGKDIHRALAAGRRVLYTPGRWRWIMAIIRAIPHAIFRRLNI
ncbi:MAG: SDR family NAD(P)-dependent oxidoreductase [Lysobacterales bacterium]